MYLKSHTVQYVVSHLLSVLCKLSIILVHSFLERYSYNPDEGMNFNRRIQSYWTLER